MNDVSTSCAARFIEIESSFGQRRTACQRFYALKKQIIIKMETKKILTKMGYY